MSQFGTQNGFNMNPTQPGGMLYNQNMIPGNNFISNPGTIVTSQPAIMATPVAQNNQPNFQNQPQNISTQNNYQQTYLPGRIVNSLDEIAVMEVPMNSPATLFPTTDLSTIYLKYWNENGIQTKTFVEKVPEEPAITGSQIDILEALDGLMKRVEKLENNTKPTPKKSINKEEII